MASTQIIRDILPPTPTVVQPQVKSQVIPPVVEADNNFVPVEYEEWSRFELILHVVVLFLSIGIVILSVMLIWRVYFS